MININKLEELKDEKELFGYTCLGKININKKNKDLSFWPNILNEIIINCFDSDIEKEFKIFCINTNSKQPLNFSSIVYNYILLADLSNYPDILSIDINQLKLTIYNYINSEIESRSIKTVSIEDSFIKTWSEKVKEANNLNNNYSNYITFNLTQ